MFLPLNYGRWPMMMGNSGQNCPSQPPPSQLGAQSAFKSVPSSCPNTLMSMGGGMAGGAGCKEPTPGLPPPSLPPQPPPPVQPLCPQYGAAMDERAAAMAALKDSHCGPGGPHPAFPMSVPMWLQHSQAYNLSSHLHNVLGQDKAAFMASQYLADPLAMAKSPFLDFTRYGHYPLGKKLFGCPQCRYITDRKNNLKRHIATMHQECDKTLECCGVAFKNKASLRDHVLIFHSNGYMCRFCGRNFCRKALLKRHLTVHSGQKDYVCSLCDYATSHKSNLERHKKVHERQGAEGEDAEGSEGQHHPGHHAEKSLHAHDDADRASAADSSFTSDLGDADDLALAGLDVDDDQASLIDVVDLAS